MSSTDNSVPAVRAAQYLRMSTEHQQYSMLNQEGVISTYARQHNFDIVKTYADPGRSGLRLHNRPGLVALLQDVVAASRDFNVVLVYDVSRWGRFQDADESAHYEFLCKQAGVPVHYCAEQFPNDGSIPNTIMKALKRSMAAEYSRELSARVCLGSRRAAEAGFHMGSTPGYGLRRMLLSADKKPKQLLSVGEEKSLRIERVTLVPGPPEEIAVIRLIYRLLLEDGLSQAEIIRELARRGITNHGHPWTFYFIHTILSHPKYAGMSVWARTESKLHSLPKRTPQQQWVVVPEAWAAIVDANTFQRAQKALNRRKQMKHLTEDQLLDRLRKLLKKTGQLNSFIIDTSRGVPAARTYQTHFGSLKRAFQLIGYQPPTARLIRERTQAIRRNKRIRNELIHRLVRMFPNQLATGPWEGHVQFVQENFSVAITICRSEHWRPYTTWIVSPRAGQDRLVSLVCLLNDANRDVAAFFLFSGISRKQEFRVHARSAFFADGKRLRSLRGFYRAALNEWERLPRTARESQQLFGVPEIAQHLRLSPSVVRRLLRESMPVVRDGRRGVIADASEVSRWVEAHGVTVTRSRNSCGRFVGPAGNGSRGEVPRAISKLNSTETA